MILALFFILVLTASSAEAQEVSIAIDDKGVVPIVVLRAKDYSFSDMCESFARKLELRSDTTTIPFWPRILQQNPENSGKAWVVGMAWQLQFEILSEELPPILQKLRGEAARKVKSASCQVKFEFPYGKHHVLLYTVSLSDAEDLVKLLK